MDTAGVTISNLQRQIEQTENQITLLLGEIRSGIVREGSFDENVLPPEFPPVCPPALSNAGPISAPPSRT